VYGSFLTLQVFLKRVCRPGVDGGLCSNIFAAVFMCERIFLEHALKKSGLTKVQKIE